MTQPTETVTNPNVSPADVLQAVRISSYDLPTDAEVNQAYAILTKGAQDFGLDGLDQQIRHTTTGLLPETEQKRRGMRIVIRALGWYGTEAGSRGDEECVSEVSQYLRDNYPFRSMGQRLLLWAGMKISS